jgi:hypothetical protein
MSRLDIEILRPCAPVVCLKSLPHGGSTGITAEIAIMSAAEAEAILTSRSTSVA